MADDDKATAEELAAYAENVRSKLVNALSTDAREIDDEKRAELMAALRVLIHDDEATFDPDLYFTIAANMTERDLRTGGNCDAETSAKLLGQTLLTYDAQIALPVAGAVMGTLLSEMPSEVAVNFVIGILRGIGIQGMAVPVPRNGGPGARLEALTAAMAMAAGGHSEAPDSDEPEPQTGMYL